MVRLKKRLIAKIRLFKKFWTSNPSNKKYRLGGCFHTTRADKTVHTLHWREPKLPLTSLIATIKKDYHFLNSNLTTFKSNGEKRLFEVGYSINQL